jgi:3'(2'), 5'-bisphosphate nucleotidase
MDVSDSDALIAGLLPAVREAGRLEMEHFRRGVVTEKKADLSPVTAADREAEAVIVHTLSELVPGIPIIAEEAAAAGASWPKSDRFFLVEALDGTRLFVKGKPEFSINIAMVVDRIACFGLIFSPATERLFVTRADGAAYEARLPLEGEPLAVDALKFQRCKTREPDLEALVAFNSQSAGSASAPLLRALAVRDARPFGSAMKFCMIAAGEGDIYARLGETYEWDTAAGQAILEAAGGTVATLEGERLTYGHAVREYRNPHFIAWGRKPLWRRDDQDHKSAPLA